MAVLIVLAAILVTPHAPALAQSPPSEGKKVALLIGVNKYEKRGFRDLEYAERDVEELGQVLAQGGYEIHLLTGGAAGEKRATLRTSRRPLTPRSRIAPKRTWC